MLGVKLYFYCFHLNATFQQKLQLDIPLDSMDCIQALFITLSGSYTSFKQDNKLKVNLNYKRDSHKEIINHNNYTDAYPCVPSTFYAARLKNYYNYVNKTSMRKKGNSRLRIHLYSEMGVSNCNKSLSRCSGKELDTLERL